MLVNGYEHALRNHDGADDPRASYEHHPVEDLEPLNGESRFSQLGDALAEVFVWLTNSNRCTSRRYPHVICARTLVLIYTLRPDLVPVKNLTDLARLCRVPKSYLSKLIGRLRSITHLRRRRFYYREPARLKSIGKNAKQRRKQYL